MSEALRAELNAAEKFEQERKERRAEMWKWIAEELEQAFAPKEATWNSRTSTSSI